MLDRILIGSSAEPTDPNFRNVTLLLHGDGSNGAQNNTFLDSSTNNFTITRNGNTTQGSFSPYGSNWSNYFDGSGDNLTIPSNAAFGFGTGDFTIEFWAYIPTWTGDAQLIGCHTAFAGFDWLIQQFSSGQFRWLDSSLTLQSGTVPVTNQWNHYAVTRSGTTLRIFLNGTQTASGTSTANIPATKALGIMGDSGASATQIGYMSNVRILKGTALYTAAFTPSTTPLTAITNTSLLTCQSNRFRDGSTNNFTITRNGDVKVTNFAPFAPSSAYSTSTNGGSGYFDGTGDYLSAASNAAFNVGTGNWTFEAWVYPTARAPGAATLFELRGADNASFAGPAINSDGTIQCYNLNGGFGSASTNGAPLNAWTHVAVVRNSGVLYYYINGVASGSTTMTNNWTGQTPMIGGQNWNSSYMFTGYMCDARFAAATAIYTSGFTPNTSPLTAVSGTTLLTKFQNAAIFDNSMKNDLETVGNAQISTSVKKFGTGSMAFDGSGDWLVTPDTDALDFGSGNFTAEAWVYFNSLANEAMIMGQWSGDTGGTTLSWALMLSSGSSGYLRLITSSNGSSVLFDLSTSSTSFTLSTGQWYHIAAVRNGSTFTIYVDGTSRSSTTNSSALYNATNNFTIGAESNTQAQYLNGYIDDLRITKGVARYTANFTPPTAAFPNK